MYELSTPVLTTFEPSLDALIADSAVPSPSNIYDSSQFAESNDYPMLASVEEPFLPLDTPTKFKNDCASTYAVSILESVANRVAIQVKEELIDDCLFTSDCAIPNPSYATSTVRIKCEDQVLDDLCRIEGYQSNSFDQVQNLLMKHIMNNVQSTCQELYISPDPLAWNCEDVHKWILYTLKKANLSEVNLGYFSMNGVALCSLSEREFRQRDMDAGEMLYTQLELWKAATGCYRSEPDFQPEDSLLDISAYLQPPQSQIVPGSRERSQSPESTDMFSQAVHSDYSSDGCGFQSDGMFFFSFLKLNLTSIISAKLDLFSIVCRS
ncbi:hypothetical protein CHUAL_011658 [Chamberlinius hualienensis]